VDIAARFEAVAVRFGEISKFVVVVVTRRGDILELVGQWFIGFLPVQAPVLDSTHVVGSEPRLVGVKRQRTLHFVE
jgi:hypothetical protein